MSFKTRTLEVATPEQQKRQAKINPPLETELKALEKRQKLAETERQLTVLREHYPEQSEADNRETLIALKKADNQRTQANRLTNIARDIHANRGPVTPCSNVRADSIQNTAISYRKHAIDLGYSHVAGGQREKDATDGGQEILENFLLLDLTTTMSCPRLLMLAENAAA